MEETMETKPQSPAAKRFSGFADTYDRYRPTPPADVIELLCMLAQVQRPGLVVDLGCGTGLSTKVWLGRAEKVIGIEPSDDMRKQAEAALAATAGKGQATKAEFRAGYSHATGLEAGSADIVTCSQSLHWMEPVSTFREVGRILRPGGVFAAIDCDWPPTLPDWRAEQAWTDFLKRVHALEDQHGINKTLPRWPKDGHLKRMQESGIFRHTKDVLLHNRESGSGDRLAGLAESFGGIGDLRKAGLSDDQIGLTDFARQVREILGGQERPWFFSYHVRVGIK